MKVKEYIQIINTAHKNINMSIDLVDGKTIGVKVRFSEYGFNLKDTWNELVKNVLVESKENAYIDESLHFLYSCGSITIYSNPDKPNYKEDNVVKALTYIKDFLLAHEKK